MKKIYLIDTTGMLDELAGSISQGLRSMDLTPELENPASCAGAVMISMGRPPGKAQETVIKKSGIRNWFVLIYLKSIETGARRLTVKGWEDLALKLKISVKTGFTDDYEPVFSWAGELPGTKKPVCLIISKSGAARTGPLCRYLSGIHGQWMYVQGCLDDMASWSRYVEYAGRILIVGNCLEEFDMKAFPVPSDGSSRICFILSEADQNYELIQSPAAYMHELRKLLKECGFEKEGNHQCRIIPISLLHMELLEELKYGEISEESLVSREDFVLWDAPVCLPVLKKYHKDRMLPFLEEQDQSGLLAGLLS